MSIRIRADSNDRAVRDMVRTQSALTEAEAICAQLLVFNRHQDPREQFNQWRRVTQRGATHQISSGIGELMRQSCEG